MTKAGRVKFLLTIAGIALATLAHAMEVAVIPMPIKLVHRPGSFRLDDRTRIVCRPQADRVAALLRIALQPASGFPLPIARNAASNSILLAIDKSIKLGDEGYRLAVAKDRVEIRAAAMPGLFYGAQTFRQLLPANAFRRARIGEADWSVPCLEIEDAPRFRWRGMMIDTARYFMPKEFLLKFIDLLALHKMNVLHLHLTDDQGWRIEIKRYPKLTEIGAWRKESMAGHYNDQKYDGRPHGGFYTQEDLREVVAYAAERFVTVVPEIEMPGHSTAAIAAYPELGNTNRKLDVGVTWGVSSDVFNVEDSTIEFLKNVLLEVMDVFPSRFIHIGGDECPKTQWRNSERAQAKKRALGLSSENELQSWFVRRIDAFLTTKDRRLLGWDEILEGGLAPGATVMSWRGMNGGIEAAKAGHDVVMAPTDFTYFDYYQSKEKGEPVAIGGYLSLETAYRFEPIPGELTSEEARHVLGAQGQLWSEYIPNSRHMEYMAFPRMCALAEVVWTNRNSRNYQSFMERLSVHIERLQALDVNFRKLD